MRKGRRPVQGAQRCFQCVFGGCIALFVQCLGMHLAHWILLGACMRRGLPLPAAQPVPCATAVCGRVLHDRGGKKFARIASRMQSVGVMTQQKLTNISEAAHAATVYDLEPPENVVSTGAHLTHPLCVPHSCTHDAGTISCQLRTYTSRGVCIVPADGFGCARQLKNSVC